MQGLCLGFLCQPLIPETGRGCTKRFNKCLWDWIVSRGVVPPPSFSLCLSAYVSHRPTSRFNHLLALEAGPFSHWPGIRLGQLSWLSIEPKNLPVLDLPALGLQTWQLIILFNVCSGGLGLFFTAGRASLSVMELPSQPTKSFLRREELVYLWWGFGIWAITQVGRGEWTGPGQPLPFL